MICRTVLSSSGNDGKVWLCKQTVGGVWRTAGHISVEQEEEKADEADVDMDEPGRQLVFEERESRDTSIEDAADQEDYEFDEIIDSERTEIEEEEEERAAHSVVLLRA